MLLLPVILITITATVVGSAITRPLILGSRYLVFKAHYLYKRRRYVKKIRQSIKKLDYFKFIKYIKKLTKIDDTHNTSNISKLFEEYKIADIKIIQTEKEFFLFFTPDRIKQYFIDYKDKRSFEDIEELIEQSVMKAINGGLIIPEEEEEEDITPENSININEN